MMDINTLSEARVEISVLQHQLDLYKKSSDEYLTEIARLQNRLQKYEYVAVQIHQPRFTVRKGGKAV